MGRILMITEVRCEKCDCFMEEIKREKDDIFAESGTEGQRVRLKIVKRRCAKCQPGFEQEIKEAGREGKIKKIPPGESAQDKKDQQPSFNNQPSKKRPKSRSLKKRPS